MGKGHRSTPSKKRLTALLVVCGAVFILFAVRLVWMQFVMADHYAEKVAEASQTSYNVDLPAARGTSWTGTVPYWPRTTRCMT